MSLLIFGGLSHAQSMQDSSARDSSRHLEEVSVSRSKSGAVRNTLGVQHLDIADMALMPSMLGEVDPLRSMQTLPGMGHGGDGNPGLYVRGAEPGHNLVTLNNMPIFNPNHLIGIFSVFNPHVIQHLNIYRGAPPAERFGRISSYIDLQSDWHRPDSTRAVLSAGLLHANAGIKTVIARDFWLAIHLRKTFMNQTLWPILKKITPNDKTLSRTAYDLYDINVNAATPTKSGMLSFSLYHGGDNFGFALRREGLNQRMDWHNTAMRVRLEQRLQASHTLAYQLGYSNYRFGFGLADGISTVSLTNRLGSVQGNAKWSVRHGRWRIGAGTHATFYNIYPLEPQVHNSDTKLNVQSLGQQRAYETQAFADVRVQFNNALSARTGLSYTYFKGWNHAGGSKNDKGYHNVDPSFHFTYQLTPILQLAASWHRSHQALHFLPLTSNSLPADFWVGVDRNIAPSTAGQIAAGVFGRWVDAGWEAHVEVFDRKMNNLYEYGGQLLNLVNVDGTAGQLLSGKGRSYGVEAYLRKHHGRVKGYLSYTRSRSFRWFPDIEENHKYPFKYDRPNQFHGVVQYKVGKRWMINTHFTYSDGSNFTPEIARYFIGNNVVSEYGTYHGARLPAYHRLDIGATYSFRNTSRWKHEVSLSIMNVYNRKNALFQYYEFSGQLKGDHPYIHTESETFAILPILPSISYTVQL